jgi:hypothetical protein
MCDKREIRRLLTTRLERPKSSVLQKKVKLLLAISCRKLTIIQAQIKISLSNRATDGHISSAKAICHAFGVQNEHCDGCKAKLSEDSAGLLITHSDTFTNDAYEFTMHKGQLCSLHIEPCSRIHVLNCDNYLPYVCRVVFVLAATVRQLSQRCIMYSGT